MVRFAFAISVVRQVVVAIAVLLAAAARADDWPQWRGAQRDGTWREKGIVETIGAEGLKFSWRAEVGFGYSSPVVAGGRVYVTDSQLTRPKARERMHCFDERTGKPLWMHAYDADYPDWAWTKNNELGPTATPVVRDDQVCMLGAMGQVHCLDAAKGDVVWERDLSKDYPGKELWCRSSPLIEGGLLILFVGAKPGATVIALDLKTGKEAWKALDEGPTHSSPMIIERGRENRDAVKRDADKGDAVRQLVVWTEQSVTALEPGTGKTIWRAPLMTAGDYVVSTPVFERDQLLLGGLMMKLDGQKPEAAPVGLWPKSRVTAGRVLSNTSTALLRGDCVSSAKSAGGMVCLDAKTGEELWKVEKVTDMKSGASLHITPELGTKDGAWLFNERGELIRADLTREGYKELWRGKLIEPTYPFSGRNCAWTAPAFANRHVFARSDRELVCATLAAADYAK